MSIFRYSIESFRRRYRKKTQFLVLLSSFHNVIIFCLAATPIINTNKNRQSSIWRTSNQMSSAQRMKTSKSDMILSSEKFKKSRSGMLGHVFGTNANANANASLFTSTLKDSKYYHRRFLPAFQPSPMHFPRPSSIQRNNFKICRPRQAKNRSLYSFCQQEEDGYEKSHHERLPQWLSDAIQLVHASTSYLLPIIFILSSCLCIDPQTSLALTSTTTTKENIHPTQTMVTAPSTGTSAAQPPNADAASTSTEDSQNARPYKGKRYWDTITNPDTPLSQIRSTNEALLDLAVGTINNMYYDNSGGASFSTQDMYDRWRLLRVYAKEGIDGVKELKQREIRRLEQVRVQVLQDGYVKEDYFGGSLDPTKDGTFLSRLILNGNDVQIIEGTNTGFGVGRSSNRDEKVKVVPKSAFDSRENAVEGLKWLVSTLNDPFSKYLTREELREELEVRNDGFLGLGALVETPPNSFSGNSHLDWNSYGSIPVASSSTGDSNTARSRDKDLPGQSIGISSSNNVLSKTRVLNLPVVTAVSPDSPAERAGIVVGDRIAAVGGDKFVGLGRDEVKKKIKSTYSGAENYVGYPDLTIAKPIVQIRSLDLMQENIDGSDSDGTSGKQQQPREQVLGYKLSRVRLPTQSISPFRPYMPPNLIQFPMVSFASNDVSAQPPPSSSTISPIAGGDAIVHYEMLTPDDSIFSRSASFTTTKNFVVDNNSEQKVGYIRLTRFSRSSTKGYINAIKELEKAGAQSFIIDVRNNYGGVIQESMLTASSLLRDPHTVLCYTMNSRGGFTPHDVEEYIVDKRYPGYLLSSEKPSVSLEQVKREDPEFVSGEGWYPPSSYASLHEQRTKRGIRRAVTGGGGVEPANAYETISNNDIRIRTKALRKIFSKQENLKRAAEERKHVLAQKKIVILMNEGTASSAEVFVSSLKDNGRTVALVGTRTYGKGLIQHTFPMPDGGGLRLTVAEYLTPALQHVTKVGDARIDPNTGDFSGGVKPDIYCPSTQGIPSNIGADICVGMALDALQDADTKEMEGSVASYPAKFKSNAPVVTQGIVRDDF